FGLDENVDAMAVGGDGEPDLAPDAVGEALAGVEGGARSAERALCLFPLRSLSSALCALRSTLRPLRSKLFPRLAAVAGDVQAAAGAAAGHFPGPPPRLPKPRENDPRVLRIEADRTRSCVGILLEHLFPGFAAVGGAVDAALRVRAERVAEHRRERDVRIRRVDDDLADL